MRIEVRSGARKADPGIRNYTGLRLMSVLDHLVRTVEGVTVCLDAVAGRDGPRSRCRMLARLASSEEVCVEATDAGIYGALDGAAEALATAIAPSAGRHPAPRGDRLTAPSP